MKRADKSPGVRAIVRDLIMRGARSSTWKPDRSVAAGDIDAALKAGLIWSESDGITREYGVTDKGRALFPDLVSPIRPNIAKRPQVMRHGR